MKKSLSLLIILALSACAGNIYDRRGSPALYLALDSQPDGYTGSLADGYGNFEIVSTLTDGTTLCRVVNINTFDRFQTESFCKLRGGEWR